MLENLLGDNYVITHDTITHHNNSVDFKLLGENPYKIMLDGKHYAGDADYIAFLIKMSLEYITKQNLQKVEIIINKIAAIMKTIDPEKQERLSILIKQPINDQLYKMCAFTILNDHIHKTVSNIVLLSVIGDKKWEINLLLDEFMILFGEHVSPDLYGELFQRTITDRKKLGAFYTQPSTALLLALLAIPNDVDANCKIADFACGAGSLLIAAFRVLQHKHKIMTGKELSDIPDIAENFAGFDILPTATQATWAALFSIIDKTARPEQHSIMLAEYGGNQRLLGSLEFIKSEQKLDNTESCVKPYYDIILMNPPYVRNKGPGRTKNTKENYSQMFEAFNTSNMDAAAMRKRLSRLYKHGASSMAAGLSTHFFDLAHSKIKPGGIIGLILPKTCATGASWSGFRHILATQYDVTILYYPETLVSSMSFKTSMGELMVVARKLSPLEKSKTATIVNSPTCNTLVDAVIIYKKIKNGEIKVQKQKLSKQQWILGSDGGLSSLQSDHMIALERIAKTGLSHMQIRAEGGPGYNGVFCAPMFDNSGLYKCLWNNHSKTQKTMRLNSDSSVFPVKNFTVRKLARVIEKSNSRVHANIRIRITSQALLFSYTKEPTIGGSAWPSLFVSKKYEKPLVVWGNTTMGIYYWWLAASKQQPGRLTLTFEPLRKMKIYDFTKLSDNKLDQLSCLFDELALKQLRPVNLLGFDSVRKKLDDGFLSVTGFDVDVDKTRNLLQQEFKQRF